MSEENTEHGEGVDPRKCRGGGMMKLLMLLAWCAVFALSYYVYDIRNHLAKKEGEVKAHAEMIDAQAREIERLQAAIGELEKRVEKLESRPVSGVMEDISEAFDNAGEYGQEMYDKLQGYIHGAGQEMDKRLDEVARLAGDTYKELEGQYDTLRKELDELRNSDIGRQAIADAQSEIDELRERLEQLVNGKSSPDSRKIEVLLYLAALEKAVSSGGDIDAIVASLSDIAGDEHPQVKALIGMFEEGGFADFKALQREFAQLESKLREGEGEDGFWDDMPESMKNHIKVRKAGQAEAEHQVGAIAQAVRDGELARALSLIDKLPEGKRGILKAWEEKLRSHIEFINQIDKSINETVLLD